MITITPMIPQRPDASRSLHPSLPMRGIFALACILAAMSFAGLCYGTSLYVQDYLELTPQVTCR